MAELLERVCEICGRSFVVRAYLIARGKGKTCCVRCRCIKASRSVRAVHSGAAHYNFKGGMFIAGRARGIAKVAHNAVRRALLKGALVKRPCADCAALDVEAHHEDYTKPLVVIWLCFPCHRSRHLAERKAS